VYFLKSKNKICVTYPIAMGGYALSSYKGAKEAENILEQMDFPLDRPWRYDPHLMMYALKGNKQPQPNDHKRRPVEERLDNMHSWVEVKALLAAKTNPDAALA
jgi:hypothetical protein